MSEINLGIIGGGQLGSLLSVAAKKLNIKTTIYSDDPDAPAQNFSDDFVFGNYNDKKKILEFINKVDLITYEFENIPFDTLNEINKLKKVLPKPSVNRLIQHRLAEKDFVNKLNIRTTRYVSIEKKSDIETLEDFLPGILKTTTMGYDGKGQYPIKKITDLDNLNLDFQEFTAKGFMLGHASVVSIPKDFPMVEYIHHLFEFSAEESCGKCFPGRLGSYRGKEMFDQAKSGTAKIPLKLLNELLVTMQKGCLCALCGAIPTPIMNILKYFGDEMKNDIVKDN